jgi:hypothetical protein
MSNTTNIFDLPVDPAGGGGGPAQNIALTANESRMPPQQQQIPQQLQQQQSQMSPNQVPVTSLDQNTINNIVSGIQQASIAGVTQLPSRDIPTTTNHIAQDPQIQPNYVPPPPPQHSDYISSYEDNDDIVNNYNDKHKQSTSLDNMYDELQTPLLLAVLFFLFQLPFFKKYLFAYLPMMFLNDGNYNIYGFVFMSTFFAFIYYLLNKCMNNLKQY